MVETTLTARLMRPAEYERFVARLRADQARNTAFALQAGRDLGEDLAERMVRSELPEGLSSKNNFLYCFQRQGVDEVIGTLWYQLLDRGGETHAFLMDLHLEEAHRGDELPDRALALFEQRVTQAGARSIHVRLFAHNGRLRSLLQRAGYLPSEAILSRRL